MMIRIVGILLIIIACRTNASPLHEAVKAGDLSGVEALIADGADVNEIDFFAGTPLHVAALDGKAEIAERLVRAGADPKLQEFGNNATALHYAAWKGRADVARLLLEAGAPVDARSDRDATPLHLALEYANAEVAMILIDGGADIYARNNNGLRPLHLAARAGLTSVYDRLELLGARPKPAKFDAELLRAADARRGKEIFYWKCAHSCHKANTEQENMMGPHLWGVVGRDIASAAGFRYSQAFQRQSGDWTYERLNAFVADPTGLIPGTHMYSRTYEPLGLTDPQDRADVIAYLRLQTDEPRPLP